MPGLARACRVCRPARAPGSANGNASMRRSGSAAWERCGRAADMWCWPTPSSWNTPSARPSASTPTPPSTPAARTGDCARALGGIGDDRTRFAYARPLKAFPDTAPVTRASGLKHSATMRVVRTADSCRPPTSGRSHCLPTHPAPTQNRLTYETKARSRAGSKSRLDYYRTCEL